MFDPVLKRLADRHGPALVGWFQRALGLRAGGPFEVVQPNLPAVALDADRVYRVASPAPMLLHTEWESSPMLGRPDRFLVYNTLLTRQTGLPVQTVVVLLRKEANSADLTGVLTRRLPDGADYLTWRYSVLRLWELPPAQFLTDPGLTPLAPLGAVSEPELPALARQIERRWRGLAKPEVRELKAATETLMGLRFDRQLILSLFGEVRTVEESVIYQEIVEIGKAKALDRVRETLIEIGTKQLGVPSKAQRKRIEQVDDLDRLSHMTVAAVDAPSWATVLATR